MNYGKGYFFQWVLLLIAVGIAGAQTNPLELKPPIRYLALGDSYTIGQSVPASERWPVQLADSLQIRAISVDTTAIIASTGWTTGSLLNAVAGKGLAADGYNLVSLLIGVNNQYLNIPPDVYRNQFRQLLDSCLVYARQDTSSVFVVSIPDYAFTPFGNGNTQISGEIDFYNRINDSITATYGMTYFDITPISRSGLSQPELVAPDGLHPSGLQYSLWVSLMLESIDQTLTRTGEPPHATSLLLYPVPARDRLHIIGLPPGEPVDIRIWDAAGRLVLRRPLQASSDPTLYLGDHRAGLYLLQAYHEGRLIGRSRFIIR